MRFAVYTAAIWGVGLGVSLMVEGDLGVAPNDVLNTGLADTLGIGVGVAAWLTGVVAMALSWSMGRRPLVATVVGSVVVGLSITGALALLPTPDHMAMRIAFVALGLAVVWAGITGVVSADVGAGPLDRRRTPGRPDGRTIRMSGCASRDERAVGRAPSDLADDQAADAVAGAEAAQHADVARLPGRRGTGGRR